MVAAGIKARRSSTLGVEGKGFVYDATTDTRWLPEAFYLVFRAEVSRRYSRQEVAEAMAAHGHWGPWPNG